MKERVIVSFVVLLFVVSFISAVWWNPFTWGEDVKLSSIIIPEGDTNKVIINLGDTQEISIEGKVYELT
jgi:hypothetical protein